MGVPASENNEKFNDWLESQKEIVMRVQHDTHKRYRCYEMILDLDDFVEDAFRDVYEGRRHPPADKSPLEGMIMVVGSKVSNWRRRERRHQPLEDVLEHPHFKKDPSLKKDPTELLLLHCYMREVVRGDAFLVEMVEILIKDPGMKPRDVAAFMELPITEVYKALKRLERRVGKERNH